MLWADTMRQQARNLPAVYANLCAPNVSLTYICRWEPECVIQVHGNTADFISLFCSQDAAVLLLPAQTSNH